MNDEVQQLVNNQVEKRLTKLEETTESIKNDLACVKSSMNEVKYDIKNIMKTNANLEKRWEDYEEIHRKNYNDLKMNFIKYITTAIVAYILGVIGINIQWVGLKPTYFFAFMLDINKIIKQLRLWVDNVI